MNLPDLKDKWILITGASRGIGANLAYALASQQANLVLQYRGNISSLDNILKKIKDLPNPIKIECICFDLKDAESIKSAMDNFFKIKSEECPLYGLINNAGISKDQLLIKANANLIHEIFDANSVGPMILTSLCARHFIRQKSGSIVTISSIVGLMGNPGQSVYAASKAALIGFTKSVAKELASKNVRCNAIAPGFIQTDMTESLPEKTKEQYLSKVPMERLGMTEDIANITLFLLSQVSGYITGEVIKVDGGLYI